MSMELATVRDERISRVGFKEWRQEGTHSSSRAAPKSSSESEMASFFLGAAFLAAAGFAAVLEAAAFFAGVGFLGDSGGG